MKLYALLKYKKLELSNSSYDLSDFNLLYRQTIKKIIEALTIEVIKDTYQSIENNGNIGNVIAINETIKDIKVKITLYQPFANINPNTYTHVILSESECSERLLYNLVKNIHNDSINMNDQTLIEKFNKNPEEFDKILKIQKEIDETKLIMYDSIEKILQRGEKIENLLDRTANLSVESKFFLKNSQKMNKCCILI